MSHFSVMVIGDDIARQLQPYHEFECTGIEDEFVKDVDLTDEARALYSKAKCIRLKDGAGVLHDFFDAAGNWRPEFSQPNPNAPDWAKSRMEFVPAGFTRVEVPAPEVESFAVWCEGWYGRSPRNVNGEERLIKHTNPNAKWDWWTIGGRWSNKLKLKAGGHADSAMKRNIDIAGMRDAAGAAALARWERAAALTGGAAWEAWDLIRDRTEGIDVARALYNAQPAVIALRADNRDPFFNLDQFLAPKDRYVQEARDSAIATFAVVRNGEWAEKGSMGWFGCASNEMPQSEWNKLFNDMLDGLPDDTRLTVVDCHI